MTPTWRTGTAGMGDTNYIAEGIARAVDTFIAEYLRVNAISCRAKFTREAVRLGLIKK